MLFVNVPFQARLTSLVMHRTVQTVPYGRQAKPARPPPHSAAELRRERVPPEPQGVVYPLVTQQLTYHLSVCARYLEFVTFFQYLG